VIKPAKITTLLQNASIHCRDHGSPTTGQLEDVGIRQVQWVDRSRRAY